jgi:hypothetical protein
MATNSSGNCYLCGATLGKAATKNHFLKKHGEDTGGQECYLLKVEGAYNKNYWLYIDVPVEKTLSYVDTFLRAIWLECCGHMSVFLLPQHLELDMDRKLKTFDVGTTLSHHYDFGTTTETDVTIMGTIRRKPQKEAVRLLARNVPPVFRCAKCGGTAEYICTQCVYETDNPFYCGGCAEEDEHGEEMMLPVSNSPRMGECGYTGEEDDTFTFNPAAFASGKES